jgi:hypothetical protein
MYLKIIAHLNYIADPCHEVLIGVRGSVSADVRYNRAKIYSRKYTTGYITNTQ